MRDGLQHRQGAWNDRLSGPLMTKAGRGENNGALPRRRCAGAKAGNLPLLDDMGPLLGNVPESKVRSRPIGEWGKWAN